MILQEAQHRKVVNAWIEESTAELPSEQLVLLFGTAIQELQARTLRTLSDVTLNAIFDRVIFQCAAVHPLLNELRVGSDGISLGTISERPREHAPVELIEAFRCFLIELLKIIDILTGGVLKKPLYQTLIDVNVSDATRRAKNVVQMSQVKGREE